MQVSNSAWLGREFFMRFGSQILRVPLGKKPEVIGLFVEGWPNGRVLIRALSYDEFPTPT
jgi:hypothetical protein